jgi:hypothetical protein
MIDDGLHILRAEKLFDFIGKENKLEIMKRLNLFAVSSEVKFSNLFDNETRPCFFFYKLDIKTRFNWLIYELSKLEFLSNGNHTNWEKINYILHSDLLAILISGTNKESFQSDDYLEFREDYLNKVNTKFLKNKRDQWKIFCKNKGINPDFYSRSVIKKITDTNLKIKLQQVTT